MNLWKIDDRRECFNDEDEKSHRWARGRWLRDYRVWYEICRNCGVVRLYTTTRKLFMLFPSGERVMRDGEIDKWEYSEEKLIEIAKEQRVEDGHILPPFIEWK